MATLDFESDQFLHLLTDALRAGPGSPQWHDAVNRLRQHGAQGDEYRLLCAARQYLESGKEYRSVRAGPEFTRRIMLSLEQAEPPGRRNRLPTATVVAIISGVVVVAVAVLLAMVLFRGVSPDRSPIDALAASYFIEPIASTKFDGPLADSWRTFGTLRLETTRGLRPVLMGDDADELAGGGILLIRPLPLNEPVAIEASLRVTQLSPHLIAQVFITDERDISSARATAARELVWSMAEGTASVVLPQASVEAQATPAYPLPRTINVRILLDAAHAIIESDGRRMWGGAHRLPAKRPLFVGLRFLRRAGSDLHLEQTDEPRAVARHDAMVFQSLRVLGRAQR
jgi:hypothetical protein